MAKQWIPGFLNVESNHFSSFTSFCTSMYKIKRRQRWRCCKSLIGKIRPHRSLIMLRCMGYYTSNSHNPILKLRKSAFIPSPAKLYHFCVARGWSFSSYLPSNPILQFLCLYLWTKARNIYNNCYSLFNFPTNKNMTRNKLICQ